ADVDVGQVVAVREVAEHLPGVGLVHAADQYVRLAQPGQHLAVQDVAPYGLDAAAEAQPLDPPADHLDLRRLPAHVRLRRVEDAVEVNALGHVVIDGHAVPAAAPGQQFARQRSGAAGPDDRDLEAGQDTERPGAGQGQAAVEDRLRRRGWRFRAAVEGPVGER